MDPSTRLARKYNQIRALIESAGGRFISVRFVKKDGSVRDMTVQPAALKFHIKGDEASPSAKKAVETRRENNPNLLNVWDVQKHAPRSINMDTLQSITVDKVKYEVTDQDVIQANN